MCKEKKEEQTDHVHVHLDKGSKYSTVHVSCSYGNPMIIGGCRPGHARAQPGLQIGTQPFCCLLSSTMNQDRLSSMALLYIERDLS